MRGPQRFAPVTFLPPSVRAAGGGLLPNCPAPPVGDSVVRPKPARTRHGTPRGRMGRAALFPLIWHRSPNKGGQVCGAKLLASAVACGGTAG
jgi:hypothetical protein